MLHAFTYGIFLAIGLILPLGVQNIFIFNQGATQKRLSHAFPSVITAFVCDTALILCAVFGLSMIVLTIPWLKNLIYIVGFFFLSYMGWVTWHRSQPIHGELKPLSTKNQIAFAASVSILNPHAIMDTIAVIGTSSLHFIGLEKLTYTLACIFVSLIWFFSLSVSGHFFSKVNHAIKWIQFFNKFSAIIMWCVAIYSLKCAVLSL